MIATYHVLLSACPGDGHCKSKYESILGLMTHRVQGMAFQRYGGLATVARLHHGECAGLAGAHVAGCLAGVAAATVTAASQGAPLAFWSRCITWHTQHCSP